jgi:hypothetical protein
MGLDSDVSSMLAQSFVAVLICIVIRDVPGCDG